LKNVKRGGKWGSSISRVGIREEITSDAKGGLPGVPIHNLGFTLKIKRKKTGQTRATEKGMGSKE